MSDGRCDCTTDDGGDGGDDGGGAGCASMSAITATELQCVFPSLSSTDASSFASTATSLLGGTLLANACEWAAFLGNVGTESAGLTEWTQDPCRRVAAARCFPNPAQ